MRPAIRILVALVAVHLGSSEAAGQFTPFQAAIAEFDAEVARGVAEDAGGAVSVAVFQGDRALWASGGTRW